MKNNGALINLRIEPIVQEWEALRQAFIYHFIPNTIMSPPQYLFRKE